MSLASPEGSRILLVGSGRRAEAVARELEALALEIDRAEQLPRRAAAKSAAIVLVTPRPSGETIESLEKLPPLFVFADPSFGDAAVRSIYAAGATAVIHWPRERKIAAEFVAERLGIALARGRRSRSHDALRRTVLAHVRLVGVAVDGLKVRADDAGRVALRGTVQDYPAKLEILRATERIPGVRAVDGAELLVAPTSRTDAEIARAVRSVLRASDRVDPRTLSVRVDSGSVRLEGVLPDRRTLRALLELIAVVGGVRGIDERVTVSVAETRKDAATAKRINATVGMWFPDERVTVTVYSGVAEIAGKLSSLARRREIEAVVERDPFVNRMISKLEVRKRRG